MSIVQTSKYHPDLFSSRPYQMCTKTVMDTTDVNITFDENGVCNHYHEYFKAEKLHLKNKPEHKEEFKRIIEQIKAAGKGKKYDCLIGLSGGVDSTYVAYLTKELGLRPLAVHFDNGWNSELAVHNVNSIVETLGIDLYTLVVDWEEFRDIQLAYLRASVIDIEIVSDHAISATMLKLAKKRGINYVISGTNIVTEQILPSSWVYNKLDFANLKDIHDTYGSVKIKTYPFIDFKRYVYYVGVNKLTPFSILDYIDYNKEEVKKVIADKLGWRDYGGKHYESSFTKFYQVYILPNKFGVDKRKAHLSTLICSGQLTREEALKELNEPLCDETILAEEKEYVLKKWGLTEDEFENIMKTPPVPHTAFKSDKELKRKYMELLKKTKNIRKIFKK
jgi:N-acetyl sugar amidotransferase